MKVGILGSGIVGKTLAEGFIKHGHRVMVGSRSPDKLAGWKGVKVGRFADAAAFGEVVVLAVKGSAAAEALRQARPGNLRFKPVLDVCNPIEDLPPANGVLRFFTNTNESLMEQLQLEFPDARLVKVFNSVGAASMVNPEFKGGKPTMFICGNDEAAKKVVGRILNQFGWETSDMGKVEAARAIEPLCILWCIPGFLHNQRNHAFKLLVEPGSLSGENGWASGWVSRWQTRYRTKSRKPVHQKNGPQAA